MDSWCSYYINYSSQVIWNYLNYFGKRDFLKGVNPKQIALITLQCKEKVVNFHLISDNVYPYIIFRGEKK